MPAAAVIPAPIAYIKVVAVKTLVVGVLLRTVGLPFCGVHMTVFNIILGDSYALYCVTLESRTFTLKK